MNNKIKIFLLIALSILFVACANKNTPIKDLSMPQDASYYINQAKDINLPPQILQDLKKNYLQTWFSPWTTMEVNENKNEVFWIVPSLLKSPGYGENLEKNSLEYTHKIYEDMDLDHYPSADTKAIITSDTNVRAVPTDKPRYNSPNNYPFDRWQNSLIFQGTPVLITHYDLTKQWAHIQSSFVYGWVKVGDVAKVSKKDISYLLSLKNYVVPDADKIPLYDNSGNFLTQARMGEIFALKPQENNTKEKKKQDSKEVYIYKKKPDGYVALITATIKDSDFSSFPKKLDFNSMASVINSMMGEKYGWGGSLENRDCSAFTRDSFANFGILLPRNSAAQVKYAKNMVDLSSFKPKEKEKYIIDHATPFATILWLKGHIMLYIGTYNGKAVVAHNAWSIGTSTLFSKQQNMLGGVVITTLWAGEEKNGIFSHSKLLIDRVLGMSDLYNFALDDTNKNQ